MGRNNGVPAWVWIGCGCGLCLLLIFGAIVAVGFAGFSFVTSAVDDMADPNQRQTKAEALLGAENGLPAGYHAHALFSFPFALKLATLSDGPEPAAPEGTSFEDKAEMMVNMFPSLDTLGAHTFIYLEAKGLRDDQRIEDVFGGERVGTATTIDLSLEFAVEEALGAGSLDAAGTTVDWRAARGTLGMLNGETAAQWVALRFRCADDTPRAALWVEHPPLPAPLAESTRLTAFLDHFSPCD